MAVALLLSACASGFSLEDADVDRTILTGSTGAEGHGSADRDRLSDETTIRNAVSSANLTALNGAGISWANVETGSQGLISAIQEYERDGSPCRSFTATRESFDGVAMFRGDACLGMAGYWRMQSFEAL